MKDFILIPNLDLLCLSVKTKYRTEMDILGEIVFYYEIIIIYKGGEIPMGPLSAEAKI